jgi:hypothetical protein
MAAARDPVECPSPEEFREFLSYDPEIGVLTWAKAPGYNKDHLVGKEAGALTATGYRRLRFNGKYWLTHRVVWMLETGQYPATEIDHKDRNRANNRFANLRLATPCQNQFNVERRKSNTTGFTGVFLQKSTNRYFASHKSGGKREHLGYWATPEEAAAAYQAAIAKVRGEFLVREVVEMRP